MQEESFELKWFQELSLRRGNSSSKVATVEFFPIDEGKVLWKAQVKFIAINGPKSIVDHDSKDNRPIEIDITLEWNDNVRNQIVEQSRLLFFDKRESRLKECLFIKSYVERANIIRDYEGAEEHGTIGCRKILGDIGEKIAYCKK